MEEPSEEPSAEPMLTRNALTALLPTLALGWPANDTSCHTGRGLIYGVHFSGLEIETVPAKDYGECCAACGAQQTSPKQSQELCDWIEWNPSIPQPRCTLKTGEGNVAGQHNGIISGAHGEETVQHFACSTSYTCAPVPNGTPHPKNQTQAVCEASCVGRPADHLRLRPLLRRRYLRRGEAGPRHEHDKSKLRRRVRRAGTAAAAAARDQPVPALRPHGSRGSSRGR